VSQRVEWSRASPADGGQVRPEEILQNHVPILIDIRDLVQRRFSRGEMEERVLGEILRQRRISARDLPKTWSL
jgi:hypothetical protein